MKKYTASILVRVTTETRAKLQAEAGRRNVRLTDVVREALEIIARVAARSAKFREKLYSETKGA